MSLNELAKNSDDIFALALNNTKEAIIITDNLGNIVFINPAIRNLYGIPDQDLPIEQWSHYFEVYDSDGKTPLSLNEMPSARILKGQHINDVEIAIRKKVDNELKYYLFNGKPITVENRIVGTVLIAHDVTERKHFERKLIESEINYHNIINISPEAIFIHRNGEILFVNDAAIKVFEAKEKEELIGKQVFDLIHPDYLDLARQRIRKVLDGISLNKMEYKGLTLSGKVIDVDVTVHEIMYMGQKALISLGKDITKEKEITQQLKDSEERYRSLFENHSDAIFTLDLEGNFTSVNPASESLAGYKPEDVLHKSFLPLIKGEDVEKVVSKFYKTLKGTPESYECTIFNKKGELVNVFINSIPIKVQNRIIGTFGIAQDITEQKKLQKQIENMAFYDDLTGLASRKLFSERLKDAVVKINEEVNHKVSVLFLDLDRFKSINDTLGHRIGDQLLIQVAKRLEKCVRNSDTVARLGGDEFLILLENIDIEDIKEIANSILQAINEPFIIEGHKVYTTPSMGISSSIGTKLEEFDSLMKSADIAMYAAKERGKNNFQFFTEEMCSTVKRKQKIEKGLEKALINNEFQLYYQPQLELATNKIIGAEALLRWQHPELGSVAPDEFIPIAENTGLIIPIGDWVLQEACKQLKKWLDADMPIMRVSVNLCVHQLKNKSIIEKLKKILEDYQIQPQHLCIELTESVMQIKNETLPILEEIKKLGVVISIDDFGTGFSSLSYLKHLPIDELKVDKSFTQDIMKHKNDVAIIKSIIDLGNNLDLQVIAEGIENAEQMELLEKLNCKYGQGYYFHRPLPKEAFEEEVLKVKKESNELVLR